MRLDNSIKSEINNVFNVIGYSHINLHQITGEFLVFISKLHSTTNINRHINLSYDIILKIFKYNPKLVKREFDIELRSLTSQYHRYPEEISKYYLAKLLITPNDAIEFNINGDGIMGLLLDLLFSYIQLFSKIPIQAGLCLYLGCVKKRKQDPHQTLEWLDLRTNSHRRDLWRSNTNIIDQDINYLESLGVINGK